MSTICPFVIAKAWANRSDGSFAATSGEKNILQKNPRNPLISLDSDERIQGNPSFSNLVIGGFCSEMATSQENANSVGRT
jgi:hypothetical protein